MALRGWISILLTVIVTAASYQNQVQALELDAHSAAIPSGTVKTIKTKHGEVIDCVDIYQQPAMRNPLLKNHELQLRPSSNMWRKREEMSRSSSNHSQLQSWSCPEGSVPILRLLKNDSILQRMNDDGGIHLHAAVQQRHSGADIHGIDARINVWNPSVEAGDLSIAQIWITNDLRGHLYEALEAGWMVDPKVNGETRLFVFYTNDGYRTRCYNLDCGDARFVQVDRSVGLGSVDETFKPYSEYNGAQVEKGFAIMQDQNTKNWWLFMDDPTTPGVQKDVGYWAASLL